MCIDVVGIKKYIVGLIIKTSSDSSLLEKEKVYLGKLNMILVQVSDVMTYNCNYTDWNQILIYIYVSI